MSENTDDAAERDSPVWADGDTIHFAPDRMKLEQVYVVDLVGKGVYALRRSGRCVDVFSERGLWPPKEKSE